MELFFQIIGVIIAVGMFSIAFITLRHKFKKEEQEAHTIQLQNLNKHVEWKNKIEYEIENLKKETEVIRSERQKNLTEIWGKFKEIGKEHDSDMKDVNRHIEELIKEIRQKNDADHSELKNILGEIKTSVTKISSDLENHKATHDAVVNGAKPNRSKQ